MLQNKNILLGITGGIAAYKCAHLVRLLIKEGATVKAVQLFRTHLADQIQIKASGGIRDYAFAKELIDAGATRLGCSAGVAIVSGAPAEDSGY